METKEGDDVKRVTLRRVSQENNLVLQTMGLIRRSFSYLDIQSFRWIFKAMVRPHLEYAQSVWSPFRKKDIVSIENVQRRATKMLPGMKELSYLREIKEARSSNNGI